MMASRKPPFSALCRCAALLALACVGCAGPVVKEPAEPSKDVTPHKAERALETAKEPVTPPRPPPSPALTQSMAEQALGWGVMSYEDGEYKTAAKQLQMALDLGLDGKRDQAKAHKYLAFINCVTGREKSCRGEFNKALDADPKFALDPAETGHPVWGPVLRSVKAERAAKAKSK